MINTFSLARKYLFSVLSVIFLLSFFLVPFSAVKAIGISPPTIEAPTVLRDIRQTKNIRISRSPSDLNDVVVRVEKSGEYAHYLDAPEEITIPKGQTSVNYSFDIYPVGAATGDYEVKLTFKVDPNVQSAQDDNGLNARVSIITGAAAMVRFTVSGEEVIAYEINEISGSETEIGLPAYIKLYISNLGNVEWKPDSIDLAFTDVNDSTNVVTTSLKGEEIPVISPGDAGGVISLEIPVVLLEGDYKVSAKLYYKDEMVGELVSKPFSVYAAGTLQQMGELTSLEINKTVYTLGEKIRLNAIFKNIGNLPIKGVLNTDVNFGVDFLDMVRGEELSVGIGKEVIFSEIIELDKPGDYTLSSYVKFGNKKTEAKTVSLSVVSPKNETLSFFNSKIGLIALVILIVLLAVFYKFYQAKKLAKKPEIKKEKKILKK